MKSVVDVNQAFLVLAGGTEHYGSYEIVRNAINERTQMKFILSNLLEFCESKEKHNLGFSSIGLHLKSEVLPKIEEMLK